MSYTIFVTMLLAVLIGILPGAEAVIKELYTSNAVCKERYCVNPIFPALVEIPSLESETWFKHSIWALTNATRMMDFCRPFVNYDPALPSANRAAALQQDELASRMYFYHLSGMGLEPWDHQAPAEASFLSQERACSRSVAKMVCYTYFPQAPVSASIGQTVTYKRPCKNVCESYLQACRVECCDEGLSCTWDALGLHGQDVLDRNRTLTNMDGRIVALSSGYEAIDGPADACTGVGAAPSRAASSPVQLAVLLALAFSWATSCSVH